MEKKLFRNKHLWTYTNVHGKAFPWYKLMLLSSPPGKVLFTSLEVVITM